MTESGIDKSRLPEGVLEVAGKLRAAGFGAWIVGGCVRDLLLNREISDWDLATSAKPKEVKQVFRRVIPTGLDHGTVTVLRGDEAFEVTTLRGEGGYSDGRRPDSVHFVSDIEQDLARRDFTVNALALNPEDGVLVDPFGGRADLTKKTIRAVGVAKERFSEDGLRVLRAARFVATLGFELDPETEAAIEPTLDTFRRVSPERVRDEWMKAMRADKPSRAFEVMLRTGILGVTCPELVDQHGCEQNKWHAFDVWRHSLECLDAIEGDPLLKLAALLHDLGKPRTREFSDKTSDYTFYNHERVGADMADLWLKQYKFSTDERRSIVHLVRHHLICYSPSWSDAAVRRFVKRVGVDEVDRLLALGRADALGKGKPVDAELQNMRELADRVAEVIQKGAALSTRDLAIGGKDVMEHLKMAPGPKVGTLLNALLERVLETPDLNDRDALLALVSELDAGEAS